MKALMVLSKLQTRKNTISLFKNIFLTQTQSILPSGLPLPLKLNMGFQENTHHINIVQLSNDDPTKQFLDYTKAFFFFLQKTFMSFHTNIRTNQLHKYTHL